MLNFNNDNSYKLYNLLEALSLHDLEDSDIEDTVIQPSSQRHGMIQEFDRFDEFIRKHILDDNDEPLNDLEKNLIQRINNHVEDEKYNNRLVVTDTTQLIDVLKRAAKEKYFGMEGNFNWIDTSHVTKMLSLAQNAFGESRYKFNGDISKWDTHNVTNMLKIFEGCKSLKCDISNWDVSSVKWWDTGSYVNTNSEFATYCKILEKKIKNSPKYALRTIRRPI